MIYLLPMYGCSSGGNSEENEIKAENEQQKKEFLQLVVDAKSKLLEQDNYQMEFLTVYQKTYCDGGIAKVSNISENNKGEYSVKNNEYKSTKEVIDVDSGKKEEITTIQKENKLYTFYHQNGKEELVNVSDSDYFQALREDNENFIANYSELTSDIYKQEEKGVTSIRIIQNMDVRNKYFSSEEAKKVLNGSCFFDKQEYKSISEIFTIDKDGLLIKYESNALILYNDEQVENTTVMTFTEFNEIDKIDLDIISEETDTTKNEKSKVFVNVPVYSKDEFKKISDIMVNHDGWTIKFVILSTKEFSDNNYVGIIESDGLAIIINKASENKSRLCLSNSENEEVLEVYPDQNLCDNQDYYAYDVEINVEEPHIITEDEVRKCVNATSLTEEELKGIKGVYQTSKTFSDVSSLLN